jgi:hypothetical protein
MPLLRISHLARSLAQACALFGKGQAQRHGLETLRPSPEIEGHENDSANHSKNQQYRYKDE